MRRPSFLWLTPALNTLGKRFGFDAHYFAKSTVILSTLHGINMLKGLVTGYLVVLVFSKELYGEYQFAQSVVGMVGIIALPGLATGIARDIAQKRELPLQSTMAKYAMLCGLAGVAILMTIPLLSIWNRQETWPLLAIAALLFAPLVVSTTVFKGIVMGTKNFALDLRATIVSGALLVIGVLLMLAFRPSSSILLLLTMGVPAAVYLWMLRPIAKDYPSKESSWRLLQYGWQLSFATAPVTAAWYLDKLLISGLFGFNQLATFSIALLIPEQVKVWSKEIFPSVFAKQAAGADSAQRRRKLHKVALLGTVVFALGVGLYALLTPFIIPILFPHYDAAEVVLLTNVAAIGLIVIPGNLFPQYLEARGRLRELRHAHWIAAAVLAATLLWLVPLYGPLGAVIARTVFRFFYIGYAWITVLRLKDEEPLPT